MKNLDWDCIVAVLFLAGTIIFAIWSFVHRQELNSTLGKCKPSTIQQLERPLT